MSLTTHHLACVNSGTDCVLSLSDQNLSMNDSATISKNPCLYVNPRKFKLLNRTFNSTKTTERHFDIKLLLNPKIQQKSITIILLQGLVSPTLSRLPSVSSWNDQIAAGKANPLLLKIFALSPCGMKRAPITAKDYEGQVLNKWTAMVQSQLEAHKKAKDEGLPPVTRPRLISVTVSDSKYVISFTHFGTKILLFQYSAGDCSIEVEPKDDATRDWCLKAVKEKLVTALSGPGVTGLRRYKAFSATDLEATVKFLLIETISISKEVSENRVEALKVVL